ncbi:MAG TPA: PqiC family protein [Anaeromyxobacteraceae bacterium]|nr:PqiC family protein [Anaeromyxobacteraceae bacterium]
MALVGCVSLGQSPPSHFFVLSATARGSATPSKGAERKEVLEVLPPRVPDYLDRPQMVIRRSSNELEVDEFNRWGEIPSAAVGRVVEENLSALLPSWAVLPSPANPSMATRARLFLDVEELGWDGNGEARLKVSWSLLADGAPEMQANSNLRRQARSSSPEAGAEALSELLADLSREIAAAVAKAPLGHAH